MAAADEAFVAKLNSSGSLVWNTFLGGAARDQANGDCRGRQRQRVRGGVSGATWGSPVRAFGGGGQDVFVAKLNSSGVLQWNTFLGGTGSDYGEAVAVDGSGNVYVAGTARPPGARPCGPYGGGEDGFAAKLNSSGSLTWNTFLGGGRNGRWPRDRGGWQRQRVCGRGQHGHLGIARAGLHQRHRDAFAAKLASSGSLTWNTFLGGGSG